MIGCIKLIGSPSGVIRMAEPARRRWIAANQDPGACFLEHSLQPAAPIRPMATPAGGSAIAGSENNAP